MSTPATKKFNFSNHTAQNGRCTKQAEELEQFLAGNAPAKVAGSAAKKFNFFKKLNFSCSAE
jgi:hypothetical protein